MRTRLLMTCMAACICTTVPAYAATAELVSCDQFAVSGTLYLTADLNCSGGKIGFARGRGRLELNGFTIRNAEIACPKQCDIVGPGAIVDTEPDENHIDISGTKVTVTGVELSGSGWIGIYATNLQLSNSSVRDKVYGVAGSRRVAISGSTISGNGMSGVTLSPFDRDGVETCRPNRIRIENSEIIDNESSPLCSEYDCADIVSCAEPAIDDLTTCNTSLQTDLDGAIGTWGVCAQD